MDNFEALVKKSKIITKLKFWKKIRFKKFKVRFLKFYIS